MSESKLLNKEVTYSLYKDGKLYIVENVPARVDVETGEEFFVPETVEQLHKIILVQKKPVQIIQTPVYNYA